MKKNGGFLKEDLIILVGLFVFAVLVHVGRAGASMDGVSLRTDAAMYCSIAAAWGNPGLFAGDFSFADEANFITHVTLLIKFVHWLSVNVTDGNYGLAYLVLTGPVIFLHYFAFYLMGRLFFGTPWKALAFCVLTSMCYWIPWGTYWGAGYEDYSPRVIFNGLYGLIVCWTLRCLSKPRWWPVIMLAVSAMTYIHQVSAPAAAAGLWLSMAAAKPDGTSWSRHAGWLVFCGLCFVAGIIPYAMIYLHSAGVTLSADDVAYMDHILRTRFTLDFDEYWSGMFELYRQYTLLPVIPLSLLSTWFILNKGTTRERFFCRHIWLWIAGVYIVIALFVADQLISEALGRMHLEFDLVRVHRFLPFFGMCLIFIACNAALRLYRERNWTGWAGRATLFVCFGICTAFFLGGLQDMARTSFAWIWNSMDEARYEHAYAPQLARRDMIEAVRTHTLPNSTIFIAKEEQAIRYNAHRPLAWCWKDACYLYYVKNLDKLRKWERTLNTVDASPTGYIDASLFTGADYIVSTRPEDRELLLHRIGPVVWENDHYLLVRNEHKSERQQGLTP